MKKVAWMAAAAVAMALAGRPAHAQTVTCESRGGSARTYCDAGNVAGVNLSKQLGSARCERGSTWGFTGSRVWVKGGCRGVFDLLQTRSPVGSRSITTTSTSAAAPAYSAGLLPTTSSFIGNKYTTSWSRARARESCGSAVQSFTPSNTVTTRVVSRSNVSWRATNGLYGSCRLSGAKSSLTVEVKGMKGQQR
jgi:hypothetical protein